jgi:hypothetical protein
METLNMVSEAEAQKLAIQAIKDGNYNIARLFISQAIIAKAGN